jgi:16S rRNA (uracil1498-N3)-methyltransferase
MTGSDRRSSAAHVFCSALALDSDGPIDVDGDTVHHLTRVLRLRGGETVSVSDGAGRWRMAGVVRTASSRSRSGAGGDVLLEPVGPVIDEPRDRSELTLATAIPKGDRVDWLVQKATELGVDRVQFLHAERSVVRWKPDRAAKQLERLTRISTEAARQSRRIRLVEVLAPVQAVDVLPFSVVAEPQGRPIRSSDSVIAIGPEGGWTPEELQIAADQVNLGTNILRTETAAIAAITLSVVGGH